MCENPVYCELCGDCVICYGEYPCAMSKDGKHAAAHITDGDECWCDPEIEYTADGGKLVIHRGAQ